MGNNNKRPVYLNLLQIRLPVAGVLSILHRVTGVLLVLMIPLLLTGLQRSLEEPPFFDQLRLTLGAPVGKVLVVAVLWILAQHFYSGVRHLLLDLDVGIERSAARRSAWLAFVAAGLTALLIGVLI
jgi:succinate dehydrogenase / fumarate reductase cytochrome b subunit